MRVLSIHLPEDHAEDRKRCNTSTDPDRCDEFNGVDSRCKFLLVASEDPEPGQTAQRSRHHDAGSSHD